MKVRFCKKKSHSPAGNRITVNENEKKVEITQKNFLISYLCFAALLAFHFHKELNEAFSTCSGFCVLFPLSRTQTHLVGLFPSSNYRADTESSPILFLFRVPIRLLLALIILIIIMMVKRPTKMCQRQTFDAFVIFVLLHRWRGRRDTQNISKLLEWIRNSIYRFEMWRWKSWGILELFVSGKNKQQRRWKLIFLSFKVFKCLFVEWQRQ